MAGVREWIRLIDCWPGKCKSIEIWQKIKPILVRHYRRIWCYDSNNGNGNSNIDNNNNGNSNDIFIEIVCLSLYHRRARTGIEIGCFNIIPGFYSRRHWYIFRLSHWFLPLANHTYYLAIQRSTISIGTWWVILCSFQFIFHSIFF